MTLPVSSHTGKRLKLPDVRQLQPGRKVRRSIAKKDTSLKRFATAFIDSERACLTDEPTTDVVFSGQHFEPVGAASIVSQECY